MPATVALLVATKKGSWIYRADPARRKWTVSAPIRFGEVSHHFVQDPRAPKRMVLCAHPGHLGPSVYHSNNAGKTWKEASKPPAFPQVEGGRSVKYAAAFTPGHASEPGVWYAGTSPQGLFRSEDHGATWQSVEGFNEHPMNRTWCGAPNEGPPDGARLHSIEIDPRDKNHIYVAMSAGGVFESTDGGKDWKPLNLGCAADHLPMTDPEYGHDPHCLKLHPMMPDRLYQQNHYGIYRLDRNGAGAGDRWERIGKKMPKSIGDIGFPIVLHPRDPDTAWVFPMDGTTVWPRTSPGGKPAVYATHNAGKTWQRHDKGLPTENAWFTVFRQSMTADAEKNVGLYFGTTNGELWASRDEGESWKCIAQHLPRIQSVAVAYL